MKHILSILWLSLSLLMVVTACSPVVTSAPPTQPSTFFPPTATPTSIPWPTPTLYNSAPADGMIDSNCRITINYFFSFKKGFSIESYRNLFTSSSQYLADGITPPDEAPILLDLMPASEEWLRDFPGTPMPGTIFSTEPNEYVYYVKFTDHYDPNTTPVLTFPYSMKMIMVASGGAYGSCKIKGYGQG